MSRPAQDLPKKDLPERISRELQKGETIYHSTMACHVSGKFPEGKWIAQVRRENSKGKLEKHPVKGFGSAREALDYVKALRPDAKGRVHAARPGEATVAALYEYVKKHKQKRLAESTKKARDSRWETYIKPEWGDHPISAVTRKSAQEWVTEMEEKIAEGNAGTLGLPQFQKVRTDLHFMFEALDSFSPEHEDRKNPFAGLDYSEQVPRVKVTIESPYFAAIIHACTRFVEEELCVQWVTQMFLTSLLCGLREGETMALCRDQLDFEHGAILIDRALRRNSKGLDPKTRREVEPVRRQAMHLPKGGTLTNPRHRVVPMPEQLASILRPAHAKPGVEGAEWDLLWPSANGNLKEHSRFRRAWSTLCKRLQEVGELAAIDQNGPWSDVPRGRGWKANQVVGEAREDPRLRFPALFSDIDFRDTRNSFASYMNECNISQATREHILGHGGGNLTNSVYTVVTGTAFQDAKRRLTAGWTPHT